jgi:RNA polymerase sigma factor (sigma-70 family)
MNGTAGGPLLQMIRRIIEDQRLKGLPDRELLRLFNEERDEAAFHGLLRRHGKMVFGVCRQLLNNEAAAEDAFQTTFLELARKAGTIRNSSSVGSWLYGVAYRTALKSRAELSRRTRHERQKSSESVWTSSDALGRREIEEIVHAELSRFSERYRAPLVLCYLQGKTQDQAALVLGVSKGTLKKDLERGRELLRAADAPRPGDGGNIAWQRVARSHRLCLRAARTSIGHAQKRHNFSRGMFGHELNVK